MTNRTNQEILDAMRALARDDDHAATQGVSIKREHAAQLAERAWGELTSRGPDRSAEWLDGCAAGVEKAAEIIRRGQVRVVKS